MRGKRNGEKKKREGREKEEWRSLSRRNRKWVKGVK